jgi:hypothetical protein
MSMEMLAHVLRFSNPQVSRAEHKLLMVLAYHTNHETGMSYPGRRLLAQELLITERHVRVLTTCNRKPPLRCRIGVWGILGLPHPVQIEVVLSERVDVFPHQRSGQAQCGVIDFMPFRAEVVNQRADVQRVPSDHGVMQHRQATERVELIAELAPSQGSLLAEAQKPRQVMGGLTLI